MVVPLTDVAFAWQPFMSSTAAQRFVGHVAGATHPNNQQPAHVLVYET
jgi:hypothetical protein